MAVFVGDIDAPVMLRMNEQLRRAAGGLEHVFLLVDQSRAGAVTAEARRLSVEGTKDLNIADSAVVGASFHMRVIMSLAVRVVNLIRKKKVQLPGFFATEADAREYIAERRRILFGDGAERH